MLRQPLVALICLGSALVYGAPAAEVPPPPPPADVQDGGPDAAPPPVEGEELKPEVTIIRRDKEVVEEYRINGRLYKVKVTPKHGKPYYLLYRDGPEGKPIRSDTDDLQTPQWVIFSW